MVGIVEPVLQEKKLAEVVPVTHLRLLHQEHGQDLWPTDTCVCMLQNLSQCTAPQPTARILTSRTLGIPVYGGRTASHMWPCSVRIQLGAQLARAFKYSLTTVALRQILFIARR